MQSSFPYVFETASRLWKYLRIGHCFSLWQTEKYLLSLNFSLSLEEGDCKCISIHDFRSIINCVICCLGIYIHHCQEL